MLLTKSFPCGRHYALQPPSANVMKSPPTLSGCATGLCSHIFSSHTPSVLFPSHPVLLLLTGVQKIAVSVLTDSPYRRTPIIRALIIRIGLVLQLNSSRILQNLLALKLPVIGSSTVECYGL